MAAAAHPPVGAVSSPPVDGNGGCACPTEGDGAEAPAAAEDAFSRNGYALKATWLTTDPKDINIPNLRGAAPECDSPMRTR